MARQSIVALCFLALCLQATLIGATAVPAGRAAIRVKTYDPRKQSQSQSLNRGGERGGSAVAVKTMPANQIKILK